MRILQRLKRPQKTSYKPPKKIVITKTEYELLKRLNVSMERYFKIKYGYKKRYGG